MLNTVERSSGAKVTNCAVTYRAGGGDMFGTCPSTCALNPTGSGADSINREYESAVRASVPRGGLAWLYTHFNPRMWRVREQTTHGGQTVFNYSADKIGQALRWIRKVPVVFVVPSNFWDDKPNKRRAFFGKNKIRGIRCPNELNKKIGCATGCGGSVPLCARTNRDYMILFTGHGNQRKLAGLDTKGGCYAAGGNVRIHWQRLARARQLESDSVKVRRFARQLPARTLLRHHISGDLGLL
jgi:hypothetical protein